nr:MAG TPA: HNH endonuclease bacteriophage, HNH Endonuclease, DNA.52A [Caudoviricetes sp.]
MIRSYTELITLPTFVERFRYLKLGGQVGVETFGYDRYLNQILYRTAEWKRFRNEIIVRDNGCDLGCEGYEIVGQKILVHHINPISIEDVLRRDPKVFDPENVICTILNTHNAIHYGDESLLVTEPIERKPNDTCLWRR